DRGRLPGFGDDDGGQLFCFGGTHAWDASSTLAALAATLGDATLAVARPGPEVSWMLGEHPRTAATGTARWPSRLLRASGYFVSRSDRGHLVFAAGRDGFLDSGHAPAPGTRAC